MGCAASTSQSTFVSLPTDSAAGSGRHGPSGSALGDFLPYYTLANLQGRDVFGPFLKLQSYDPATGNYQLSALVVCSRPVQQQHNNTVKVKWWELQTGQEDAPPTPHHHRTHRHRSGAAAAGAQGSGVSGPEPQKSAVPHSAPGELLFTWRDWRFWRFRFGATCGKATKQLRYQVDLLPGRAHTVVVPSLDEPWHIAFTSCNGLAEAEKYGRGGGLYALWHDLLRRHEEHPFHVMLGGGDQLYNDGVFQGFALRGWDKTEDDKDTAAKAALPFSDSMREEVEEFYFSHYCVHWSRPAFSEALASIPSVNTWDDHDIVDGWGSYPEIINTAAVMVGLFSVAKLFYFLFQHHTTAERLTSDGYFCSPACCRLLHLGPATALLAPDSRTCRTQHRVLPPGFLDEMRARLRALPGSVRHVVVMMATPVLYPKLPIQETLQKLDDLATGDTLASIVMQKTGLAAKVTKRFGMMVYLDDIIDQWAAKQHEEERDQLLTALAELAAEKRFRVSILSGDVHLAGHCIMHSRRGVKEADVPDMPMPQPAELARDPRFIPQIISSAILNVPPPNGLVKLLCLAGRAPEPLLKDCVQRTIPLFGPESETSSLLHGRRNWCEMSLGDAQGSIVFSLRCEHELGSEKVNVFTVRVPPLLVEEAAAGAAAAGAAAAGAAAAGAAAAGAAAAVTTELATGPVGKAAVDKPSVEKAACGTGQ